jgi:hypothetical protein
MSRRTVRITTMVAVLGIAVVASVALRHDTGGTGSRHGAADAPPQTAQSLLHRAWATNGSTGYFIDDAGTPGAALSLYDTAWWQRAVAADPAAIPQWRSRLDSDAVAEWVLPILYGRADTIGQGDTAGMPRLAVLEAAVVLATSLHVKFDTAAVAAEIEKLRTDEMYSSQPTMPPGDWASTGAAVGLLRSIGRPAPDAVLSNLRTRYPDVLTDRSRDQLFSYTIPVLASMDPAEAKHLGSALAAQLEWVASQLPTMTPLQRLTATAVLQPLVRHAAGPAWPRNVVCRGITFTPEGVKLSEQTAVDARATATAVEVGCGQPFTPPPWTVRGWPNRQAVTGALQASVAGVQIADKVGDLATYRVPLTASLTRFWLPSQPVDEPARLVGIRMLAHILRVPWTAPDVGPLVARAMADETTQALPALLIGWLTGRHEPTPNTGTAVQPSPAAGGSVLLAAADELKHRLTGDERYHTRSIAMLQPLLTGKALYAAIWRTGNPKEPSPVATAIAAWIMGQPLPVDALRSAGLCNAYLVCGRSRPGTGSPLDSPLRATAAVLVATHPDPATFPVAL